MVVPNGKHPNDLPNRRLDRRLFRAMPYHSPRTEALADGQPRQWSGGDRRFRDCFGYSKTFCGNFGPSAVVVWPASATESVL